MSTGLAWECGALGVLVALVALAPRMLRVLQVKGLRWLGTLGRRPGWAALLVGLATGGVAAVHAHVVHWPEPSIHDEFAYLLGAETFAGGELARPTPAHADHFETFHILQEPSYAPKYPPGQSLALAAGFAVADEPRAGLWMQLGLMAAAFTWMLFGWLPARWALLTAALAALQLCIATPWSQTFFGGGLAATGGALVLGAVPRLLGCGRVPRAPVTAGLAVGAGLVVLALSRPFEGIVLGAVAGVATIAIGLAQGSEGRRALLKAIAASAPLLAAGALFLGAHNRAVTGDALRLPYQEYDAQSSIYPAFVFGEISQAPSYDNPTIERFHRTFQAGDYHKPRDLRGSLKLVLGRAYDLTHGLVGLVLLLPLLGLLLPRGLRRQSLPAACWAATVFALAFTVFCAPHYAAPGAGALFVLVGAGLRELARRAPLPGQRRRVIALAVLVATTALALQRASQGYLGHERHFGYVRSILRNDLLAAEGDDLVLVHRRETCSLHHEFVFNGARIDEQAIVWARDLGDERNRALIEAFPGRRVWRLSVGSVDDGDLDLKPLGEVER